MKSPTILIVDDNAATRKLVRITLKRYHILEAADGQEALEVLREHAPDLIIQDLRLPDIDGIELLRQMRQLPHGRDIPILAFSGLFSKIQEAESLADGFTDYIFKPIEPAGLRSMVEAYLPAQSAPAPGGAQRTLLIVNDNPTQCKLLKATFEQAGFHVSAALNGQEGLVQARGARPDAILSDILMPGLDGFQLCFMVRRDPALVQVAVILLSVAVPSEEDQVLARQLGASALLARPTQLGDLVRQVRDVLDRPAPAAVPAPVEALPQEYTHRLIRQLEEHVLLNTSLRQRLARRKAELAMFSGMLESITPEGEIETLLDRALQQCLDAYGGAVGAIFLRDEQGELQLRVQFGYTQEQQRELPSLFGHRALLQQVERDGRLMVLGPAHSSAPDQRELLARMGTDTLVLIPLMVAPSVVGVLVGTPGLAHVGEDWLEFLSLLGRQMGRMIHEVRAVAALRQSEEQYRSLVETSPDAIIQSDLAASILFCNRRATVLYGCEQPEELYGRPALEMLVPEDQPRIREMIGQLVATQQPQSGEYIVLRADGTTCPVEISSSLMLDHHGMPRSMLHVVRDISERRQIEESRRAQEAAERANQAKSEFLSRMSHELRTPLNAILGFTQVMEMGDLPERYREGVDYILKAGRHLLSMINEVLELARIEAGKLSMSPEPILLGDIVGSALELIRPLADERGITLSSTLEPLDEKYVMADRQRLLQVLLNLLSNAVKYNREAGSVDLIAEQDEQAQRVRIVIKDTGIGIPRTRMTELFVPFERLGAEEGSVEGTGLGLTLAKRLLEAMDGQIGVESKVGQGSSFWISLPLIAGPLEQVRGQTPTQEPALAADARPMTVLLIEDNFANYRLIEHILARRPNVKLIGAEHGRLGLELAREHQIDVILLDLHLPDIAGGEVFQRLQSEPATRDIPVIVLSADAREQQMERLLKDGVSAYLTKPLDVREFLGLIDRIIEKPAI